MYKYLFEIFVFCDIAWVFFRANSVADAFYILEYAFTGIQNPISYLYNGFADMGLTMVTVLSFVFYLFVLGIYDYYSLNGDVICWLGKQKRTIRYIIYFSMLIVVMCCRASGEAAFVYFQF